MRVQFHFDQSNGFTKHVERNPKGSYCVGYLKEAQIVFVSADGTQCAQTVRDLKVRRNRRGELSLSAPTARWIDDDGREQFKPLYSWDDATYQALRTHIGTIPVVKAAFDEAVAHDATFKSAPAVDAGLESQIALLAQSDPKRLLEMIQQVVSSNAAAPAPSAPVQPELPGITVG